MQENQIEDLKKGDLKAWDAFISDIDPLIRSVVAWQKWHFAPHTQDDLCQKIRTDLTKSVPQFKGESSIEYFVKKICIRRCIDEVRRQVRSRELFVSTVTQDEDGEWKEIDAPSDETVDPIRSVILSERASILKKILESIDKTCQIAIQMFYLQSLTYKEISEHLGIAVNTVGSRLAKCLNKLKGFIKSDPKLREDFHA